jgi:hAT family C-terminal dimerisation region
MRETSFPMFGDISHTELPDLRKRSLTVVVVSSIHTAPNPSGRDEQPMEECIEDFRELYAKDMLERCGVTKNDGTPTEKLPVTIAIAALLNPLYGGQTNIVKSGLMTREQYKHAEHSLIGRMQLMRERDSGHIIVLHASSGSDDDSACLDDPIVRSLSTEREKANNEFRIFCNLCKMQRNRPTVYESNALKLGPCDMRYPITMGKVVTKGDDIRSNPPFVNCNLADFIASDGRFDLLGFMELQKNAFPTLYKLSVCLASIRTNEVGCERFFSTAGYVSCPRRTSLNVRNYECLATLRSNMKQVYIDEKWVVDQYLEMEKSKSWNVMESKNDMLVLELERELAAEREGVSIESLPPAVGHDEYPVVAVAELVDD